MEYNNITAVDVFCGIGGLSKGLENVGVNVKLGLDFDNNCQYAYEENINATFLHKDIRDNDIIEVINPYWESSKIKILAGCAPCQPFSTHSNKKKDRDKSDKWSLINYFFKIVKETEPDIITMENVPNLKNQVIFDDFVKNLRSKNYYVSFSIVYCPDYGIPQKRRRLVLLASKFGQLKLIEKTHKKENYKTVRDTIGNLNDINNGEYDLTDRIHKSAKLSDLNLKRIKKSKQGGTWEDWDEGLRLNCHKKASGNTYKSVYGRMKWDEPSPTITTQFYNYGTGRFGHPKQDRALSVREAALLQTFPEDYALVKEGEEVLMTQLGTHIGNAVPVRLGEVIGKSILEHLGHYGKI